ncbi:unnamed protein product, partial [Phaeothamnion confervicola]
RGRKYCGLWQNGRRHGEGRLDLGDGGGFYKGGFADDRYDGRGTLTTCRGDILSGDWRRGVLHGRASLHL